VAELQELQILVVVEVVKVQTLPLVVMVEKELLY
jgi:hypothetical protein